MTKKPGAKLHGEYWQKQRMRALVRDNFTCQAHLLGLCKEPCTENRLRKIHVHHVQWRSHGGDHDLDNLLTLCKEHHILIHPHMRFEYAVRDKILDAPPDREL